MKLYDFGPAANAQRVRMFIAEKGMAVPIVELDVRADHQFAEPFASMNPFHCVPFLELDDGTVIAESISVCRYLGELHPEPSLFGRIADITAYFVGNMAKVIGVEIDADYPNVHRWHTETAARPSTDL